MGHIYPDYRVFILFFSLLILAFLAFILMKTRLGITVRAMVSDRDMASALGTNTPFVFMLVMGIGSWLAGLAGVIAAPFLSISSGMGLDFLTDCFIVTVTGGLGSLLGSGGGLIPYRATFVLWDPLHSPFRDCLWLSPNGSRVDYQTVGTFWREDVERFL